MKAVVFGAGDIRTNERWREQKRLRPVDVVVLLKDGTNCTTSAEQLAQMETSRPGGLSAATSALASQKSFKASRIAPEWIAIDLKPVN